MPRPTTAKPLTDEQKRLAAGTVQLVNHFIRNHKPDGITCADFRSEMYLAVVKGASRYDPSKGSFGTWAHRFMEQHARHLRHAAYQKSTFKLKGERFPRQVKVYFVDSTLFECVYAHRIDGVYYCKLPERNRRQHHL